MKGYLAELDARAAAQRTREDTVSRAQAAAERDRRTSLDDRLKHLLSTIPPEVQDEGLSIVAVQVRLCCGPAAASTPAVLPAGWVTRCGGWGSYASGAGVTAGRSFRAVWRKRQVRTPIAAPSTLIEDA